MKPTEPLFTSPDNERAVHFSTSSYRPIHLPKSHPAKHRRLHWTTINQLCRIRIESPPRNTKQHTHLDCTPIPSEILTCQEQQIYSYPQMPTRLPDHRIKLPRKNTISKERRSLYQSSRLIPQRHRGIEQVRRRKDTSAIMEIQPLNWMSTRFSQWYQDIDSIVSTRTREIALCFLCSV